MFRQHDRNARRQRRIRRLLSCAVGGVFLVTQRRRNGGIGQLLRLCHRVTVGWPRLRPIWTAALDASRRAVGWRRPGDFIVRKFPLGALCFLRHYHCAGPRSSQFRRPQRTYFILVCAQARHGNRHRVDGTGRW